MAHRSLCTRAVIAVALLCAGRSASAQRTAYDLERLWLDPSARGSLVVGTGETLPAGGLRLAVAGGYERQPLVLTTDGLRGRGVFADTTRIGDVVRDRWTLHLAVAAALTDRIELGARLPMTVSQEGDGLTGLGFPRLRSTLAGTPSGMLRVGLTQQARGAPVSSAIAAEVAVPIHDDGDLDGEPEVFYAARLEVGRRFDHLLMAADVGATIRPDALALPGGEELRHELTGGAVVATTGAPLRFELALRGALNDDDLGAYGELLAGARWGFRHGELFALAGPGLGAAPGTPSFRGVVGLALFTAERSAPAPVAAAPAAPARPATPVDPCAEGMAHGPEQCPTLDDDGDGVANALDRCPLVEGVADLDGCPQVRTARAEITGRKIELREKVFFDTGEATLQPRSLPLLDEVAALLRDDAQAGRVRVEGHTDDRGRAAANRRLSQARAEAVRAYLVAHGVDAARLEAQGFGPDRPAAPNTTADGREANRRVEFTLLDAAPQP